MLNLLAPPELPVEPSLTSTLRNAGGHEFAHAAAKTPPLPPRSSLVPASQAHKGVAQKSRGQKHSYVQHVVLPRERNAGRASSLLAAHAPGSTTPAPVATPAV